MDQPDYGQESQGIGYAVPNGIHDLPQHVGGEHDNIQHAAINSSVGGSSNVATLVDKVKRQVEYYFSQENFPRDTHLHTLMDEEGYVQIAQIAGFPKVSQLTQDISIVTQAMRESAQLMVHPDGLQVKPVFLHSTVVVYKNEPVDNASAEQVKEIFPLEIRETIKIIEHTLRNADQQKHKWSWYIHFDKHEEASAAHKYIQENKIEHMGQKISAKLKFSNLKMTEASSVRPQQLGQPALSHPVQPRVSYDQPVSVNINPNNAQRVYYPLAQQMPPAIVVAPSLYPAVAVQQWHQPNGHPVFYDAYQASVLASQGIAPAYMNAAIQPASAQGVIQANMQNAGSNGSVGGQHIRYQSNRNVQNNSSQRNEHRGRSSRNSNMGNQQPQQIMSGNVIFNGSVLASPSVQAPMHIQQMQQPPQTQQLQQQQPQLKSSSSSQSMTQTQQNTRHYSSNKSSNMRAGGGQKSEKSYGNISHYNSGQNQQGAAMYYHQQAAHTLFAGAGIPVLMQNHAALHPAPTSAPISDGIDHSDHQMQPPPPTKSNMSASSTSSLATSVGGGPGGGNGAGGKDHSAGQWGQNRGPRQRRRRDDDGFSGQPHGRNINGHHQAYSNPSGHGYSGSTHTNSGTHHRHGNAGGGGGSDANAGVNREDQQQTQHHRGGYRGNNYNPYYHQQNSTAVPSYAGHQNTHQSSSAGHHHHSSAASGSHYSHGNSTASNASNNGGAIQNHAAVFPIDSRDRDTASYQNNYQQPQQQSAPQQHQSGAQQQQSQMQQQQQPVASLSQQAPQFDLEATAFPPLPATTAPATAPAHGHALQAPILGNTTSNVPHIKQVVGNVAAPQPIETPNVPGAAVVTTNAAITNDSTQSQMPNNNSSSIASNSNWSESRLSDVVRSGSTVASGTGKNKQRKDSGQHKQQRSNTPTKAQTAGTDNATTVISNATVHTKTRSSASNVEINKTETQANVIECVSANTSNVATMTNSLADCHLSMHKKPPAVAHLLARKENTTPKESMRLRNVSTSTGHSSSTENLAAVSSTAGIKPSYAQVAQHHTIGGSDTGSSTISLSSKESTVTAIVGNNTCVPLLTSVGGNCSANSPVAAATTVSHPTDDNIAVVTTTNSLATTTSNAINYGGQNNNTNSTTTTNKVTSATNAIGVGIVTPSGGSVSSVIVSANAVRSSNLHHHHHQQHHHYHPRVNDSKDKNVTGAAGAGLGPETGMNLVAPATATGSGGTTVIVSAAGLSVSGRKSNRN